MSIVKFTYTPRMTKAYDVGYFKTCSLNSSGETMTKCKGKSKGQVNNNYFYCFMNL